MYAHHQGNIPRLSCALLARAVSCPPGAGDETMQLPPLFHVWQARPWTPQRLNNDSGKLTCASCAVDDSGG